MKSFFRFTAGEWAASALIGLLIMVGILFHFLHHQSAAAHADTSKYQSLPTNFKQPKSPPYSTKPKRVQAFSGDSLKKLPRRQLYDIVKVELNTADTTDIMRIPQFGSKRSQRVVEYRDKLGGFHDFSQLQEIYILQNINEEYLEKYFTIDRSLIQKININQCDYQTLIAHPYIDSYLCKTILHYRQHNGPIRDMAHLREITHIYPELEEKLQWYIEF